MIYPKKLEKPHKHSPSNHPTDMQFVRHTTPSLHFTKPTQCYPTTAKLYLMLGIATTVLPLTKKIDTSQLLSGVSTIIVSHLKDTLPWGMSTVDSIFLRPPQQNCIDDTLIWFNTIEEAFFPTVQWLNTCGLNSHHFQSHNSPRLSNWRDLR